MSVHRYQRGGRGGGPRSGGNSGGAGASGKEWTFGLHSFINGVFTPVQLVSVRADARMLHYGAEVSFTQTYKNPGSTPLDATYVFPVPFQGTVTAFEATIDGVAIITHVRDRQAAPKERQDDPQQSQPVIMFVTDHDRLYLHLKAIVPNLPAGKTAAFKLTYVTDVSVDEDRMKLSVPLKFTTVKRTKPEAGAPAPPPPLERDSTPIDLNVALEMPDVITSVETNGATIFHLSGQSQQQAAVSLAPTNFVPYDFVVFTRLASARTNRVSIETHPSGARLAILDFFVPGLQSSYTDGGAAAKNVEDGKDEKKEEKKDDKEEKKDDKEPSTAATAPVTSLESPKEDIALPSAAKPATAAAPGAKHGKKRFSASDLSIESSDKSLNFVALPVAPTRGRVTLFVPLPADFAGASVSVGPKDAPGVVQLQIDNSIRPVNSTIGHRLYARAFIRELESELDTKPSEARAEEIRKSVIAISTRFSVPSNSTQFVSYEKVGEDEKEIAPLARKRPPPAKQGKESAPPPAAVIQGAPVPAAAAGASATPEQEKKGDAAGERKERGERGKREKLGNKPAGRLADGVPAAAGKAPAAAPTEVASATHAGQQGQQQRGGRGGERQGRGRDAPRTQEHEATSLFRSLARLQAAFGAWNMNRSLADVICIEFNEIQSAIRTNTTPNAARVWGTVLALAFLELGGFDKDPSDRAAVLDVMNRARKWLAETVPGKEGEWLGKAKAFVSDHIELVDA